MKKSYLMIAVAALAMVSCAQDDQLKNNFKENDQQLIGFNSFAEKATRGEVNNRSYLEFYNESFSVYSTKQSTVDKKISSVFDGGTTSFVQYMASADATLGDWAYSPYRMWDKQAYYQFAAVSPNNDDIKFIGFSGMLSASGDYVGSYSLAGDNVFAAAASGDQLWRGWDSDIDLMTADTIGVDGKGNKSDYFVTLNFKHILAKLNIAVKKDDILASADVNVKYVKIANLSNSGNYDESNYTVASGEATKSGWEVSGTDVVDLEYKNESGDLVYTNKPMYFVESLVMPQAIASGDAKTNEQITITYVITTKEGGESHSETFTRTLWLADAWTYLYDRNNYILTLTIKPEIIKFDAVATSWADKEAGLTVE